MKRRVWIALIFFAVILIVFIMLQTNQKNTLEEISTSEYDTLKIVLDDNYPPYIFKDSEGFFRGILIDQWELWEEKTGIQIEYYPMSWDRALTEMENGKYDVIDTIFKTSERERLYDFSKPYIKIEVPIFFPSEISGITEAKSLEGFNVAVKAGDACVNFLENEHITNLTYYDSYEDIISAAKSGNVSIFVMDKPPAQYFLFKENIQTKFNYSKPLYSGEFHRAVSKGNTALLDTLEKGFSMISEKEYEAINTKWFGESTKDHKYSTVLIYGLYIILLVLTFFIIISYMLKKSINKKTKLLNELIDELKVSEEKYRLITENVTDVIWTTDLNFKLGYISPSIERLTGDKDIDYMNIKFEEKFPPEGLDKIRSIFEEEIMNEQLENTDKNRTRIIEVEHFRRDGSKIWVSMHISLLRGKSGEVTGFQGVTRDIDKRRKVEEENDKQAGLMLSLIETIPDSIFYKDLEGKYLGCNMRFAEIVGFPKHFIVGKSDIELFDQERALNFREDDDKTLKSGLLKHEEYHTLPDGRKLYLETVKTPYRDSEGHLLGILGITRDITERKKNEEEIRHIGYHDHLTGLYNRRFYEEELHRLNVKRNLPLTVVMGDVNGLKLINDSFGHSMGDELLRKAAQLIKNGCRADDIIARIGGDEFVLILPQTNASEAETVITRIKEKSQTEMVNGINISISFGYETKKDEAQDIQEILKNAEDFMYKSKVSEGSSLRSRTINLIMKTLYEKNYREMLHSKRVSKIAEEIAFKLGLDEISIKQVLTAGLVHDIGKIGVDEGILNSPEKLTNYEWKEMQKHCQIGFRILSSVNEFSEIAVYVLEHHEKWDGTGYPEGLKGSAISIQARIIAVADAYDAMTSHRTYGILLSEHEAIEELKNCAGTQFDPDVVKIFIEEVLKVNI